MLAPVPKLVPLTKGPTCPTIQHLRRPCHPRSPSPHPPRRPAPPNYLVWAILSTVPCCLPLSIAWIVFSNQVNSKRAVVDPGGAQVASRKAKSFAIWAAVIELIVDVVYGVTTVLLASKE